MRWEEGFRRLTLVVSLATFAAGLWVAWLIWSDQRSAWRTALSQPDPPIVAFVFDAGKVEKPGYVVFEKGKTAGHIERALRAAKWTPGAGTWVPEEFLSQDPPTAAALDADRFLFSELAYVWDTSKLYNRAELLRGNRANTLPSGVRGALFFPTPRFSGLYVTDEFVVGPLGGFLFLIGAVIAALIPWVLFLLLRWLARGFSPS